MGREGARVSRVLICAVVGIVGCCVGGPGAWCKTLAVPGVEQSADEWCWAACMNAILQFYSGSSPKQCDIVEYRRVNSNLPGFCPGASFCDKSAIPTNYGETDCCVLKDNCDYANPAYISDADYPQAYGDTVDILEHFGQEMNPQIQGWWQSGVVPPLDDIKDTIDACMPILVVRKSGGSSYHMVTIKGYEKDELYIMNPTDGTSEIQSYSNFEQSAVGILWIDHGNEGNLPPTFGITKPGAGDTLDPGTSAEIKWTTTWNMGKVDILLYRDSFPFSPIATLASETANDGIHLWDVPEALPAWNDYKLRIEMSNGTGCEAYGPLFSVSQGCTPNCSGKECGPDGCGDFCPPNDCGDGQSCNASTGKCVDGPCISSCQNIVCGYNECGVKCDNCPADASCDYAAEQCKPKIPVCNDECDYANQKWCKGNTLWVCKKDSKGCLYEQSLQSCSPATCKGQACGPPCGDPCWKEGAMDCLGDTSFKECYAVSGCFNWSGKQYCPDGHKCDAGKDKCVCPVPGWWLDYLDQLHALDIITDQYLEFDCSKTYNRAEWAKLLGSAVKIETTDAFTMCSNPFIDVSDGDWYKPYVVALAHLDYGDDDTVFSKTTITFNPGDKANRCEAAKMVTEAFDAPHDAANLKFSDKNDIPAWCLPYVKAGVAAGFISDVTDPFRPGDICTAGEAASMVVKAIDKFDQDQPQPSDFDHPSCQGEAGCDSKCTKIGDTKCKNGEVYFCDDHDGDTCIEWGAAQPCPNGTECIGGECEGVCVPNCAGKQCGSNGCGEDCDTCNNDEWCQSYQCVKKVKLVAGKITGPPNGSTISNQEVTITWQLGEELNGKKTQTALFCMKQGQPWKMELGFGSATSRVIHGLVPGSSLSCRVRTRLVSDYDTWKDSPAFTWNVSGDAAGMTVVSVTPVVDPNDSACEDFLVNAEIANAGNQMGTWKATAYVHPAGQGITSPEAEESFNSHNVSLSPGEKESFEFKLFHNKVLPLVPGVLEVTVVVEDVFDGFGAPSSKSASVTGTDTSPPVVSEVVVYGFEGNPPQVLVGNTHGVKVIASDDYLIESWKLEYNAGQGWLEIETQTPQNTSCLHQYGDWAAWEVPEALGADQLVDVRFQVWDSAGKLGEKAVQAATIASGKVAVEFILPAGGEKFEKSTNENGSCVPVEIAFSVGDEVGAMKVGFTNATHTIHQQKQSIKPIPDDGHWTGCINATYAGDELEVFVRVDDTFDQETFFYSNTIEVDFAAPKAPWVKQIAEATQKPAEKPGLGSSESSSTHYNAMSFDGTLLSVHRHDYQSWKKSGETFNRFTLKKLEVSIPDFVLSGSADALSAYTENKEITGSEKVLRPGRYDDIFYAFRVDAMAECPDPIQTPCDYSAELRTVESKSLSSWQFLEQYNDLILWEKPSLEPVRGGIQDAGGAGKFVLVQDSKDYTTDLWKKAGSNWSKLHTFGKSNVWLSKSGNKLWGFGRDGTGPTTKIVGFPVDSSSGQPGSSQPLLIPGGNAADGMDYQVADDLYTDSIYVTGWEWDTFTLYLASYKQGVWTTHEPVVLPPTYRKQPVSAYYRQWMMAAQDILYFEFQASYEGGYSDILLAFVPGEDIDVEHALLDVDSDKFRERKLIALPDGRLVQMPDYCSWNLEDRLCFQLSHPIPGLQDCWDGDKCTNDVWDPVGGTCSFEPVICEGNDNLCIGVKTCDPQTGECVADGQAVQCDDGLFCNGLEECDPGTGDCLPGVLPKVDDSIWCTDDWCDEDADVVANDPNDDWCMDDQCANVYCLPDEVGADPVSGCLGYPLAVEPDGLECTDDSCNQETGEPVYEIKDGFCVFGGECLDDLAPSPEDPCQVCYSLASKTEWTGAPDGTSCDDGSWCTTGDHCLDGQCVPDGMTNCSWMDEDCSKGVCSPDANECLAVPEPEGTPCGDPLGCEDGQLALANMCNGEGDCVDAGGLVVSCEPYALCADEVSCATSCEGDDECTDGYECLGQECRTNEPPVADAGEDQGVQPGDLVTLDGSESYDPDGDALMFSWLKKEGPTVKLDGGDTAAPSFVAPEVEETTEIVFQLKLSDGFVTGEPDEVVVTVHFESNEPPIAVAGQPLIVDEGELVTLDGSESSDPEGEEISFSWSQTGGPEILFDDPASATPQFTAPQVEQDEFLEFSLVVNDGELDSMHDSVTVLVRDTGGGVVELMADAAPDVVATPDLVLWDVMNASDVLADSPGNDAGSEPKPVTPGISVSDGGCSAGPTDGAPRSIWMLAWLLLLAVVGMRRAVPPQDYRKRSD